MFYNRSYLHCTTLYFLGIQRFSIAGIKLVTTVSTLKWSMNRYEEQDLTIQIQHVQKWRGFKKYFKEYIFKKCKQKKEKYGVF